ncbi:MAG TPA: hypothetical protein PK400_04950 [Phycisphaerales bacterium]|nr:hypothetical protein [Phycisphaerales bacterium]HRQ76864.1 hypothetical protein [Phycisphaerales bacterium]
MRFIIITVTLVLATSIHADVIEFTNKQAWQNAVPSFNTIDFTGWPNGLPITTQYHQEFGITFALGTQTHHSQSMPNDGQGVVGIPGSRILFDTPQKWFAVDFPGTIVFNLYYQGTLIYTSSEFFGSPGPTPFAGLISDTPFDEVYLFRYTTNLVFYDDLFFGVPAPGALGVFALAAFRARSRRQA